MTIDLKFEEIDAKTLRGQISLSHKIKDNRVLDQSACVRFMSLWVKKVSQLPDSVQRAYFQNSSPVNFAIENVNTHSGDTIEISLKYSDTGIQVVVGDNGDGFSVQETVSRFHDGEKHYRLAEIGFKRMHGSPARVGFNETGNQTFISYPI